MNQVLLEILLLWIVGIPAFAIAGAAMLARRRERLMRYERAHRRDGFGGQRRDRLGGGVRSLDSVRLARSHARFPAP